MLGELLTTFHEVNDGPAPYRRGHSVGVQGERAS